MSDSFIVNVELRDDLGKGASRRLRRLEDKIPAIVYGAGKKPQPLMLDHKDVSISFEYRFVIYLIPNLAKYFIETINHVP
ncbi:MAG: hypothetical protein COB38_12865 [Gammaproteobacteria bacterium]|nr:MAG: hypothetical protein COB38_12865 [Gammaproteobacteria bacterium]